MPMSLCRDKWCPNHQETWTFLEASIHSENYQETDTAPTVEARLEAIHMLKRVWPVWVEIIASKEHLPQIYPLRRRL